MEDTIEEQPKKKKSNPNAPDYGPWVPDFLLKYLYLICAACLVIAIATLLLFNNVPIGTALVVVTAVAVLVLLYIRLVKKMFRPGKNSLLTKLHHHLLDKLSWDGKGRLLDLGCGNGELAIRCAFTFPEAHITAQDRWNRGFMEWGYSLWQCRENVRIEDVADRVVFVPATGPETGFDDEMFDAVVSCFVRMDTTYEVAKREQVLEALRVLKKGGHFSLMGMFKNEQLYGNMDELIDELKQAGVAEIHYEPNVATLDFVPPFARLPLMVKNAGLLYGVK